jgi:hypothetical protein
MDYSPLPTATRPEDRTSHVNADLKYGVAAHGHQTSFVSRRKLEVDAGSCRSQTVFRRTTLRRQRH